MNVEHVTALSFSPTGTTAKVAETAAAELAVQLEVPAEYRSFTRPAEREQEYSFTENDLVVVGTPTYAGKMPNKLLPDFQEKLHGNCFTLKLTRLIELRTC